MNHLGEIFSENLKILCLWRYVFLQCFHPIVKKYLESYNPKTLAVIRFLAHFHLLGSRIQVIDYGTPKMTFLFYFQPFLLDGYFITQNERNI